MPVGTYGTVKGVMPRSLEEMGVHSALGMAIYTGRLDLAESITAPANPLAARVIVNRLNQEIVKALGQVEVKDKFTNAGVEIVGGTPEQFAVHIKAEMARMGKVIKAMGLREQ